MSHYNFRTYNGAKFGRAAVNGSSWNDMSKFAYDASSKLGTSDIARYSASVVRDWAPWFEYSCLLLLVADAERLVEERPSDALRLNFTDEFRTWLTSTWGSNDLGTDGKRRVALIVEGVPRPRERCAGTGVAMLAVEERRVTVCRRTLAASRLAAGVAEIDSPNCSTPMLVD